MSGFISFNNIYHLFNTAFSDKCFIDNYLLKFNTNLNIGVNINDLNNIFDTIKKNNPNVDFKYDNNNNLLFNNEIIDTNKIIINKKDGLLTSYGRLMWDFSLFYKFNNNTNNILSYSNNDITYLSSYKSYSNNDITDINFIRYVHYCLEQNLFNIYIFKIIINYFLIEKKLLLKIFKFNNFLDQLLNKKYEYSDLLKQNFDIYSLPIQIWNFSDLLKSNTFESIEFVKLNESDNNIKYILFNFTNDKYKMSLSWEKIYNNN